jgi:hypothetical protein
MAVRVVGESLSEASSERPQEPCHATPVGRQCWEKKENEDKS